MKLAAIYGSASILLLALASSHPAIFDFGDRNHGGNDASFQVHNHGTGEAVFADNPWGGPVPPGMGNRALGNAAGLAQHTGWTLANPADPYTSKNLQVLARPSDLSIDSSLQRAVFQRDSQNRARVPITGLVAAGVSSIEARATPRPGSQGTATDWEVIDARPTAGPYAGALTLDGGWYDIEVRALNGTTLVAQHSLARVGVGEVFVIAGQSNSANYGSANLAAADDRVSAFDLNHWRHSEDPQPIATGSGGSPWPAFGDALAANQGVPIGTVSVGWGGTSVAQWVPGASGPDSAPLYNRLRNALQALGPGGARAVLWHQGETDSGLNTGSSDYRQRLERIIAQSRIDAGFDIPWGVAQASYLSLGNTTHPNITGAQAQVVANDPMNFVGAATDDLAGPTWRAPDGIHFNEAGLREHADRWFDQSVAFLNFVPEPNSTSLLLPAILGLALRGARVRHPRFHPDPQGEHQVFRQSRRK